MLFNSYGFVFLFLPLAFAGYCACQKAGQKFWKGAYGESFGNAFLLTVSFLFYGWTYPEYLSVLVCSMAVNYGLSWQMEQTEHKKAALAVGIFLNLSALACFKYAGTGSFVPPGISFYTFTQIAFLMERYRGNLKGVRVLSYGLYVSFFPKIMQGPIALPGEMFPQFEKAGRQHEGFDQSGMQIEWERIYRSLYLFILGLYKKALLADTLGGAVDFGYANLPALNSGDGLIVMLSYTLQLYFDFSGYCDMAMGIAGMFGIELPLNFASPYKASNIIAFWKGWHMTLTRFFTKYLYVPLGGNRKGRGRTYLNCMIIFLVSGIWHGAGWQFVIWGLMHGVLYVLTKAWKDFRKDVVRSGCTERKLLHGISVLLTFIYVNIAWIFFRAPSVRDALELLRTIVSGRFGKINWELAEYFNLDEFWYMIKVAGIDGWQYAHYMLMAIFLAGMLCLVFFGKSAASFVRAVKPGMAGVIFMTVLFIWSILSFSGVSSFLYVNF